MQKSVSEAPDPKWSLKQLGEYVARHLDASEKAEREAILQKTKSATALFWAGAGLSVIRRRLKERHGAWTAWKRGKKLADVTVNDAIRLYEGAKTPEALAGLGVTQAKQQFVYPVAKAHSAKPSFAKAVVSVSQPTKAQMGKRQWTKASRTKSTGPQQVESISLRLDALEQKLIDELKEIAQRLAEIRQTEVGRVEWTKDGVKRARSMANMIAESAIEIVDFVGKEVTHEVAA